MKIAITQRIDFVEDRNEYRDCLDQSLVKLIVSLGHIPLLISNVFLQDNSVSFIEKYLNQFEPEGILISGGNDIGEFPERDKTEEYLYNWALKKNIPILGICRGMQLIGLLNGAKLKKVDGHVKISHKVVNTLNDKVFEKNSYHDYSLSNCPKDFDIIYLSNDGEIESIKHKQKKIVGIMWHPEREKVFSEDDLNLIQEIYG